MSKAVNRIVTPKQACFQNQPVRATCVQNTFESRDAALHNPYHTSLHPSSFFEPRHPSLKELHLLESNLEDKHCVFQQLTGIGTQNLPTRADMPDISCNLAIKGI